MKHHTRFFALLLFLLSDLNSIIGCHDNERAALLSFKSFLRDPSNRLASWQGKNCCFWHGIRCSDSNDVIVVNLTNPNPGSLILNSNSKLVSTSNNVTYAALEGTVSPSLFTLSRIRYLDLSFNNFLFSKIPTGLSNLTELTHLSLSNAMFKDTITTQFANITSLRLLDLSCSYLVPDTSSISYNLTSSKSYAGSLLSSIKSGEISSSSLNWLMGLHNLRVLKLSGVDLSVASQSSEWAKPISMLSKLKIVQLSDCEIVGKLPINDFLNLTQLSSLEMDYNFLTSSIPTQLANITSLSILDLSSSNLQGFLPYLPQLRELHISNNPGITIDLSSMFRAPWGNLEILDIGLNHVNESIPTFIANMSSLLYFSAESCSIHGPIPSSLYNLSKLEYLFLNFNYITGNLSSSISNLQSLQYLSLFQNSLQGHIPDSICQISSLQYLHLASNKMTGELPDCIRRLTNLSVLMLSENNITGIITSLMWLFQNSSPSMIGLGSSGLTVKIGRYPFSPDFQPIQLDLSSCSIGGGIPDFVSNLTNLEYLSLADNNLSGTIPSWLLNLPRLGYLDLSSNNLQGVVPPNIRLQQFFGPTTLNLAGNHLEGPIPFLPETIEAVDLSRNNFTGGIPIQVGGLQNVKYLSFSSNLLSGPIPLSFCHTNNVLMLIDLSNNSLSGTIPAGLGNCTSLISLHLARNNLRGNIPNELKAATNFIFLQLNGNHFSGPFPTFIRELQNLEVLNLGNNKFEGNIPRFIGDLQKLRILVLEWNSFNGSIPKEISNLWDLQFIGFSNNKLSGAIPDKLQCFKMLTSRPRRSIIGCIISFMYSGVDLNIVIKGQPYDLDVIFTDNSGIDLSCNLLTGLIPPEIGLLEGLFMLNLSRNSLYGEIPMSIGKMSELESLDLSFNNLSGSIPMALASLDFLSYLNLSYNNLSGEIPKGMHFDTLFGDGSPYIGNRFLCGAPDGPNCSRNGSSSSETVDADDDARQKWLFYAVVTIGFGVGLWGYLAIMYLMKEKWKKVYWEFIDRVVLRITRCITKN
ncbi:hypothetical protein CsSME_00000263 [Camellia sinensis var. sinensis]